MHAVHFHNLLQRDQLPCHDKTSGLDPAKVDSIRGAAGIKIDFTLTDFHLLVDESAYFPPEKIVDRQFRRYRLRQGKSNLRTRVERVRMILAYRKLRQQSFSFFYIVVVENSATSQTTVPGQKAESVVDPQHSSCRSDRQ